MLMKVQSVLYIHTYNVYILYNTYNMNAKILYSMCSNTFTIQCTSSTYVHFSSLERKNIFNTYIFIQKIIHCNTYTITHQSVIKDKHFQSQRLSDKIINRDNLQRYVVHYNESDLFEFRDPVYADYPEGIVDPRSELSPKSLETETRIYVSTLDRICPASSAALPRNVI